MKKSPLYLQLKADIQRGLWQAEQILTQQQLSAHYGVSRIPVRDALQQLHAEGWLVRHGKTGSQVPGYSADEAQELCQIRLQLEPMALQLAASRLSFSQLGQAEDLLTDIANAPKNSLYQRGELNWQFHRLLYQSCDKPHLLRLLDNLHQQVARYLGYQELAMTYADTSEQEHRQLIGYLRDGDTPAALTLLKQHIAGAGQLLVQYLQQQKSA